MTKTLLRNKDIGVEGKNPGQFAPNTAGSEAPVIPQRPKHPTWGSPDESLTPSARGASVGSAAELFESEAPEVASLQTADAKGEDAPPLAVKVKGGARYYLLHPDFHDEVVENPQQALLDGKAFPSVTTIMKDTVPKPALGFWMTNMAAARGTECLAEVSERLEQGDVEGAKEKLDEWLSPAKGDWKKRSNVERELAMAYKAPRDDSADRGTRVHAAIEGLLRGDKVEISEDIQGYVDGYQSVREEFPEMEVVATEVTLVNRDLGYAGTADVICRINGEYYVADWKTNKDGTVYDSVGKQLGALAGCSEILHPDGSRSPMPPIRGGIGIALGPQGQHSVVPFNTDEHYQGFVSLVGVYRADSAQKRAGTKKAENVMDILSRV